MYKEYPTTTAQDIVLKILNLKASTKNEADALFASYGFAVTPVRKGRSNIPSIQFGSTAYGGWNAEGDADYTVMQPKDIDLAPLREYWVVEQLPQFDARIARMAEPEVPAEVVAPQAITIVYTIASKLYDRDVYSIYDSYTELAKRMQSGIKSLYPTAVVNVSYSTDPEVAPTPISDPAIQALEDTVREAAGIKLSDEVLLQRRVAATLPAFDPAIGSQSQHNYAYTVRAKAVNEEIRHMFVMTSQAEDPTEAKVLLIQGLINACQNLTSAVWWLENKQKFTAGMQSSPLYKEFGKEVKKLV